MASNQNKNKLKLQVISWENGRLNKQNFYFNEVSGAIEASKYYEGKIKVYNEKGEVCFIEDPEDRLIKLQSQINPDLAESYS